MDVRKATIWRYILTADKRLRIAWPATLVILCALLQAPAFADVTAAVALVAAKGEVNDIADHASADAKSVVGDIALQINQMIDRVRDIIGDEIDKPLDQLSNCAKNELAGIKGLFENLNRTVNKLPQCVGGQVDLV